MSALANRRLREPRTWLLPMGLIVVIAAALPAIYLAATTDPQGNLAELPLALVVEEQSAPTGVAAESVALALEATAGNEIAYERMTPDQFASAIAEDRVAGGVVIPADFESSIASLLPGTARVSIPTVTIVTNAGDGGLNAGLILGNVTPRLHAIAADLGTRLAQQAGDVPPAHAALLAEPFHIASAPFAALPAHSGLGTSAFYFSLVIVLIAFIGASLVGPLVDSALGFVPSEVGPLVERRPYAATSRLRTFLTKVAILAAAAPLAAAVAALVARVVGVASPNPLALWLFSTAAIIAVGTGALAVFAALGTGVGSLVNTLFFVALALVSSGGIVPLAAVPPFFAWLSSIAPFHYVVQGVRSLLYFDGNLAAGLGGAWLALAIGGTLAFAAGTVVTVAYGRVPAFTRNPRT